MGAKNTSLLIAGLLLLVVVMTSGCADKYVPTAEEKTMQTLELHVDNFSVTASRTDGHQASGELSLYFTEVSPYTDQFYALLYPQEFERPENITDRTNVLEESLNVTFTDIYLNQTKPIVFNTLVLENGYYLLKAAALEDTENGLVETVSAEEYVYIKN
ncbi:MAG: hypothetical protein ABIF92_00790 [archaeon]